MNFKKVGGLKVLLLLIFTFLYGCKTAPVKQVEPQQTPEEFTISIIEMLNSKNIEGLQKTIAVDAFSDAIPRQVKPFLSKTQLSIFDAQKMISSMLKDTVNQPKAGFWYLHGCNTILPDTDYACTIINANWGLGPLEIELSRNSKGLKIVDLLNYSSGISAYLLVHWATSAPLDMYFLSDDEQRQAYLDFEKFNIALNSGAALNVEKIYETLPIELQENWYFRTNVLSSAMFLEEPELILKRLTPFVEEGKSGRYVALRMYYHKLRKELDEALLALDELDGRIGVTHFSQFHRADIYTRQQKFDEALFQIIPLIVKQPKNPLGYWVGLEILISKGDYEYAAEIVELMAKELNYPLTKEFFAGNIKGSKAEGFFAAREIKEILL